MEKTNSIHRILAATESVTTYFDVDGTLADAAGHLTPLGTSLAESGRTIKCATFGPWEARNGSLVGESSNGPIDTGIRCSECLSMGDLFDKGWVDMDRMRKRIPYLLVDNEVHQDNQILVSF